MSRTHALESPRPPTRFRVARVSVQLGLAHRRLVVGFTVPSYSRISARDQPTISTTGCTALPCVGLFAAWSSATGYDLVAAVKRRWLPALLLGLAAAGLLTAIVLRTDDATPRPYGLGLAGALAWRGILYGVTDGLLLSVFPILVVFAAFAGTGSTGGSPARW